MAGSKQTYEIELNPDQMGFIRTAKEKYSIADESKVVRIMVDYLLTNQGVPRDRLQSNPVPAVRLNPGITALHSFASPPPGPGNTHKHRIRKRSLYTPAVCWKRCPGPWD